MCHQGEGALRTREKRKPVDKLLCKKKGQVAWHRKRFFFFLLLKDIINMYLYMHRQEKKPGKMNIELFLLSLYDRIMDMFSFFLLTLFCNFNFKYK